MEDESTTSLALGHTGLTVAAQDEDIRGRKVVTSEGEQIGQVSNLLTDGPKTSVRFLLVASPSTAVPGPVPFLIPADAVTALSEEAVYLDQASRHIAAAPSYEPDRAQPGDYAAIESYYGILTEAESGPLSPLTPYYPP